MNELVNIINSNLTNHDKYKKLTEKGVLYYTAFGLNSSLRSAASRYIDDFPDTISINVLHKRKNSFDVEKINRITNSISDKMIKNKNEPTIYCIDGSQLNLAANLKNIFTLSKNEHYTTPTLSCVYDSAGIEGYPFDYVLDKSKNEIQLFLDYHITKIKPHSICLFDRKYFSYELISNLLFFEIDFVIRMKKSSVYVKELNENGGDELIKDYEGDKIKIVKKTLTQVVNGKEKKSIYYLLTSLTNKSVDEISNLYKKRWPIETFFKEIKSDHNITIKSKKIETVNMDLAVMRLIFTLKAYINSIYKDILKSKQQHGYIVKFNDTISYNHIINSFLFALLFKKKKDINKSLKKFIIKLKLFIMKYKADRTGIRGRLIPNHTAFKRGKKLEKPP